jgi:tetratricopeptide (TPR) repeat protein
MLLMRFFMPFVLIATIISIVAGIFVIGGGLSNHPDHPDDTAALCRQGLELGLKGQYLPALQNYDRAIAVDRQCAAAYVGRAQVLTVLADFIGSVDNCNQAISLDPKFTAAYATRGAAYYWLGEYQKALDDAQTCEKLNDSHFPRAALLVSLGLGQLGTKQYAEALNNCNQSIALFPNSPNPYSVRARVEVQQKQYEQAVSDCNKALSIFSRAAHVYETRAAAYDGLGKTDLAASDRKQAKSILDQDAAMLADYRRGSH